MRDPKVSWRIRHVLTDETPQSAGVAQLLLQLGCESFLDNGKSGLDQSQTRCGLGFDSRDQTSRPITDALCFNW